MTQNGAKESEADSKYAKLEAEQRDITSEFETLQDDMGDLTKRLGRLESEYIQAEAKIKELRQNQEDM